MVAYNPLPRPEAFMAIAALFAKRSKDPVTQVGAVLVDKDEYVAATGYNGFPAKLSDDHFSWLKTGEHRHDKKYPYVKHAELNVLANVTRTYDGGTLYVTVMPCHDCAREIVQLQQKIRCVKFISVYENGKDSNVTANDMFNSAGIPITTLEARVKNVSVDFDLLDVESREIAPRVSLTGKRLDYLPWEETFMGAAMIMAQCSKNPVYQQGAVLVGPKNKTLGFGYNGIPKRISAKLKAENKTFDWSNAKLREEYEIKGANNCMLNSSRVPNSTLYTTHFPDIAATHKLLETDVKKVIFGHAPDKNSSDIIAAKRMMDHAEIKYQQFRAATNKIDIDLATRDVTFPGLRFKSE